MKPLIDHEAISDAQWAVNRVLSMQAEAIERSPRPPRIRHLIPWWRIDIRIKGWMYNWNRRFAHRYDDRNGWKEYYESLVGPSSREKR